MSGREVGRLTLEGSSRPDGAVIYDDSPDRSCPGGTTLHVFNDTHPLRGSHNAFDVVRIMKFRHLDEDYPADSPMKDRPSYKAMCEFAESLPEIKAQRAANELQPLEPELALANDESWMETGAAPAEDDPWKEQPRPPRFKIATGLEFSNGPPLEWIVRDVLPKAELAAIFGESTAGKSFFALDLCAAIATGKPWCGKRVTQGRVLYIVAEGSLGFRKRLQGLQREHGLKDEQLPDVLADAPNLRDADEARKLKEDILAWVAEHGRYDVIFLDAFNQFMPGANENTSEDVGPVLAEIRSLHKMTGALCCLVAHAGKDASKGLRGWSGTKAALDAEIEVIRKGEVRTATCSKQKDSRDGLSFPFTLREIDLGRDADEEPITTCVVNHGTKLQIVADKEKAVGVNQTFILKIMQKECPVGTIDLDDLVGLVLDAKSMEHTKNAKQTVKRSFESLALKDLIFSHGDNKVSLSPLIAGGKDETF